MVVKFRNRKGETLFCIVEVPKILRTANVLELGRTLARSRVLSPHPKLPSVLIIHGFKGSSTQRHIQGISDGFVAAGFLTLRMDLTNNPGNSYLPFEDMSYSQEYMDLEDILIQFLKIKGVDSDRIGVAGHSLGGMLAAQLAAEKKEIKSLITLSAVYDFRFVAKRIFSKPFAEVKKVFEEKGLSFVWSQSLSKEVIIKKKFYEDVVLRSAADFAKDITCPTLVISSEKDESVSQSHADRYFKTIAAKIKRMEIVEGADHNYSGEVLGKVCPVAVKWFLKTL